MRLLLIEPFYTSSHKYWADNIVKHSAHNITLMTLPGKHWKWRMHGAAISLAKMVNDHESEFDLIMVSDMMDVSTFKNLLHKETPIWLYFHENQLAYPWSETDPDPKLQRDHHYGWINYTSALVADKVFFNSKYNQDSFLSSISKLVERMPDYNNLVDLEFLRSKSSVLPIGIDFQNDFISVRNQPPNILWNHRWEYDKNPEFFFNTLIQLDEEGIDFKLIILGQSYHRKPEIFNVVKNKLSDKIIHYGHVQSSDDYTQLLAKSDIYPVTSNQDFFGLSVLEAIANGAEPLLPNRLAYPEHLDPKTFSEAFYHSDEAYLPVLRKLILKNKKSLKPCLEIRKKYCWTNIITMYDQHFGQFL